MSERTDDLLDEIVRLIALSLRQGLGSQTDAIIAFTEAGLGSSRVAELLGTTPATVRTTLNRASKKSVKKTAAASKGTRDGGR